MGGGRRPRLLPRLVPEIIISHRTSTIVGGRVFVDGHACARDECVLLLGFPLSLWAQVSPPLEFDVRVGHSRTRSVTDSDMHDANTQLIPILQFVQRRRAASSEHGRRVRAACARRAPGLAPPAPPAPPHAHGYNGVRPARARCRRSSRSGGLALGTRSGTRGVRQTPLRTPCGVTPVCRARARDVNLKNTTLSGGTAAKEG